MNDWRLDPPEGNLYMIEWNCLRKEYYQSMLLRQRMEEKWKQKWDTINWKWRRGWENFNMNYMIVWKQLEDKNKIEKSCSELQQNELYSLGTPYSGMGLPFYWQTFSNSQFTRHTRRIGWFLHHRWNYNKAIAKLLYWIYCRDLHNCNCIFPLLIHQTIPWMLIHWNKHLRFLLPFHPMELLRSLCKSCCRIKFWRCCWDPYRSHWKCYHNSHDLILLKNLCMSHCKNHIRLVTSFHPINLLCRSHHNSCSNFQLWTTWQNT